MTEIKRTKDNFQSSEKAGISLKVTEAEGLVFMKSLDEEGTKTDIEGS